MGSDEERDPRAVERGRRIAKTRKELGLSQEFVAGEIKVRRSQVSLWETGEQEPRGKNLVKLARTLKRTPEWIMEGDPAYPGAVSTGSEGSVIRENGPSYRIVPLDHSGVPLEDELEQLRAWLPDEMARRMSRKLTNRAWLGMLYHHGIDEGWPKERLDRIDAARRRVDDL